MLRMSISLCALALTLTGAAHAGNTVPPPRYWTVSQAQYNVRISNPQLWGQKLVRGDMQGTKISDQKCVGLGKPVKGKWAAFRCEVVFSFFSPTEPLTATVWFRADPRPGMRTECFSLKGLAAVPIACRA